MAQAKVEFVGDPRKLLSVINRLERKLTQLQATSTRGAKKTKGAIDGIGDSISKAFDPVRLAGMLAGFVSVQTAIGAIKSGLDDIERRRAEAAQAIIETEMPAAKLAQLAGTHRELLELIKIAKWDVYGTGGALTRREAYATTFQLKSADALKEVGFFAQLKGVVSEIPEVAGAAAKVQAAFGEKETGRLQDIVSKFIGAAAPVTDVGVREMALSTLRGAKIAGKLGLTDEELIAAVSVVAQAAPSAEMAGTQVAAMLTSLMEKGGFKGLSLQQMVKKVGITDVGFEEAQKKFGVAGKAFEAARGVRGEGRERIKKSYEKAITSAQDRYAEVMEGVAFTESEALLDYTKRKEKATSREAAEAARGSYDKAMRRVAFRKKDAEDDKAKRLAEISIERDEKTTELETKFAQQQIKFQAEKVAFQTREPSELTEEKLKKFFGRKEAMIAYLSLTGDVLPERIEAIRAAEAGDLAQQKIDMMMGVPEIAEARALRRTTAVEELLAEPAGRQRIRSDIVLKRQWQQEGGGVWASIALGARKTVRAVVGDPAMAAMAFDEGTAEYVAAGEGARLSEKTGRRRIKDDVRDGTREGNKQPTLLHADGDPGRSPEGGR